MAQTITLRVITPEKVAVDTNVTEVRVPGVDGSMGILARHAPMVAALDSGDLAWTEAGAGGSGARTMFVAGGFAEVRDDTVRIVTLASEPASEIDVERARQAAERARERLRARRFEEGSQEFDVLRAEASLRRALMRLFVAGKVHR